ncbi:cytochrome P450 [Microbispora corallina]|uniref:Cytochrome P450 n=1 Tax=Microbispora corallina TaxID=83302 RepID=A0ABQ4G755_9ACTN|nr:cytochrome P450 [Microbispora corallina]GIH42876.1 cytochrome P450 [Microbispora corallina]
MIPAILRDPVRALLDMGREAAGEIVRVNLGPFRPYLVTHPEHLQHVLRGNAANYTRDGVFWRPLHRLFGDGIMSDGPEWELSRKVLQPVFTAKHVEALAGRMADAVAEGVDELSGPAEAGREIDVPESMARIVNRTVVRVFFGGKIDMADAERLAPAFDSIGASVVVRYLLPSVPYSVRVPGDRAFLRAVAAIDDVVVPLVERHRGRPDDGDDIFSALCRARGPEGGEVSARWIRDNLVAMLATATETTAGALTWLWPLLAAHPEVAGRLYEEVDRVVGRDRVRPGHLASLPYTGQVVQELLRLYPVGWLFPRMVVEPEVVGGVRLEAGETVVVSPYVTHRMEAFWDRPEAFDPGRFSRRRSEGRHRYAYFPFGGGPHQCIGMHVFAIEARLIVAGLLARFRPVACSPEVATPRMGASLRPRQHVRLTLRPAEAA